MVLNHARLPFRHFGAVESLAYSSKPDAELSTVQLPRPLR